MDLPRGTGSAGPRRSSGVSFSVYALSILNFVLFLPWQMAIPVVPLLALEMQVSPFWIGIIVGSAALLPLVFAIPVGWLTDRIPFRHLQISATLSMCVAMLILWQAQGVSSLILGQMLIGLSVLVASVAGQVIIAVATDSQVRDVAYGHYSVIIGMSQVIGPLLGGWLAQVAGTRGAAVAGLAIAAVAALISMLRFGRHDALPSRQPPGNEPFLPLLRRPAVLFSLIMGFMILFAYSVRSSFYVLYLDQLRYSRQTIGLLLSLSGGATLVVRPIMALAASGLGHTRLLMLVAAVLGLGLGLIPVMGSFTGGQVVVALAIGAALGFSQPLTITIMSHAIPKERLGLAFAWRQVFQRAGEISSPLVLGLVVALAGLKSVFWVAGAALYMVSAVTYRMGRDLGGSESADARGNRI